MITSSDILEAAPVIFSLVIIEGLLSVDNALAIAALAAHLPRREQRIAMGAGFIGAYVTRGIALLAAEWIVRNTWMKWFGALYLIYLMCSHTTRPREHKHGDAGKRSRGLFATIVELQLLDLSLSLDNVITAVAMSSKMWVVFTGVFIGILALRFLAGISLRLVKKMPELETGAFVLVGYVGLLLCIEMSFHFEIPTGVKFVGIALILGLTVLCARSAAARKALSYPMRAATPVMRLFAQGVDLLLWPFRKAFQSIRAAKAGE